MTTESSAPGRPATVWAATTVPARSPYPDFGADGYSVAWVDGPVGREQVLVLGATPSPGTSGRIVAHVVEETELQVFIADPA